MNKYFYIFTNGGNNVKNNLACENGIKMDVKTAGLIRRTQVAGRKSQGTGRRSQVARPSVLQQIIFLPYATFQ